MLDTIQCACGKSYSLRDAWVGTRAYCPHCGRLLQPSEPPTEGIAPAVEERLVLWKSWDILCRVKVYLSMAVGAVAGFGAGYQLWRRGPGGVDAFVLGAVAAGFAGTAVLFVAHGLSLLLMPGDFYRIDPRGLEILKRFNVAGPLALKGMILLAPLLVAIVAGVIAAIVLK